MILTTFCLEDGHPRLGALRRETGILIDIAVAHIEQTGQQSPHLVSMQALIEGGGDALALARRLGDETSAPTSALFPLSAVRLLAPLPTPPQMRDFSVFELHMLQAGVGMARIRAERLNSDEPLPNPSDIQLPEVFYRQPVYYKGNRFSVIGHDHPVVWPSYSRLLDYELEFGIYIAKSGRDIPVEKAHEFIFGYTIYNDFSARDAQEVEMNCIFGPAKGKDFDTGNAMGPWIVTPDELPDPYALSMVARVNGEEWSRGSSCQMIHRFEEMIAHVSRDETLHAGEFFGSGTIGGGCGLELDRWLRPGDSVELEVEGIGVLRNKVIPKET